jgi:chemotaxis protein CheD
VASLRHSSREGGVIEVGIGEIVVAEAPARLVCSALGSCVGVAIWDSSARRGGLAHVMLPSPARSGVESARFATVAVPRLVEELISAGSAKRRLVAKIAGGAAMFRGEAATEGVGERNIVEVKRQLALMSVHLLAEDTGEAHARTVELVLETGELTVRSNRFGIRRL